MVQLFLTKRGRLCRCGAEFVPKCSYLNLYSILMADQLKQHKSEESDYLLPIQHRKPSICHLPNLNGAQKCPLPQV